MLRRPALISGDPAAPEGSRRPGTRPGTRAHSQFPPGQPRSGKVRCRVCLFMFFKGDKYIRASRSEKAPRTEESVLSLPSGGPISPPRRPRPHDKRVPVKPERFKYNSTTGFHPQEGKPSHKAVGLPWRPMMLSRFSCDAARVLLRGNRRHRRVPRPRPRARPPRGPPACESPTGHLTLTGLALPSTWHPK